MQHGAVPTRVLTNSEQDQVDAVWASWRDLTRFHHSIRIAAAREVDVWRSISAHMPKGSAAIAAKPNGSATLYKVSLPDHLNAVESTATLSGLVLVQSWSLAETLGRIAIQEDDLPQVEQWVPQALALNYQGFGKAYGGAAGVVEASTVRNAVAHGQSRWTQRMINRVSQAGGPNHKRGEPLDLSDLALERYRSSVRSVMRLIGLPSR